jgi:hypothetical protein
MAVGAVWYTPRVFGNAWMRLAKVEPSGSLVAPLVVTLVVSFLSAWVLAGAAYIAWQFYGGSFLWGAVATALFLWVGFTAARFVTHDAFEGRPVPLTAMNVAHELVTFLVIIAVRVEVRMRRGQADQADELDQVIDWLAVQVREQWEHEAVLRRLHEQPQRLLPTADQRHPVEIGTHTEDVRLAGDRDERGLGGERGFDRLFQAGQSGRPEGARLGVVVAIVQSDHRHRAGPVRELDVADEGVGDDLVGEDGGEVGVEIRAHWSDPSQLRFSHTTLPPIPRPTHMVVSP